MNFVPRLLGGGLLAAGVAGVVGVGVALLAANQGLVLDETAFPRIAQRLAFHIFSLYTLFLYPFALKLFSPEPPPRYPEWATQGPPEWGYS